MASAPKPPRLTLTDDPRAAETFADEAIGFFHHGGAVSITFAALRCDHSRSPGTLNSVVVSRMVMPVRGAQSLAAGLFDFLKRRGLHSSEPVKAPDHIQ